MTNNPRPESPNITVVGSVAYDSVETPDGTQDSLLGGSATYFSVAASYFTNVGVVAVVGDDFRDTDRALLEEHGVDTSGLKTVDGNTFRWSGRYEEDLNTAITLETQLNVFADFEPQLSPRHADAPFLFLANIDPDLQHRVLDGMSKRPDLVACDTMNLWIDIARPRLASLIERVDALLINEAEVRQLTGDYHLPAAAAGLLEGGLGSLVIKRGEYGVALFNGGFNFAAPAYPLTSVVDPTGAGDSFAGGFMGYLAATGDTGEEALRRATVVGSVMASFTVEAFGLGRLSTLSHSEIESRYAQFEALTRFAPLAPSENLPRPATLA